MLMSCGAGAGLAAAFGAPLAGVVFVLEEIHKNFSKEILLSTMAAAISADWIASYMFGLEPVFDFAQASGTMPLSHYWMVALLGLVLGAFGVFYNKMIAFMQTFYGKLKPKWLRAAVPFVMVAALAFLYPQMLGSGDCGSGWRGPVWYSKSTANPGDKICLFRLQLWHRGAGRNFLAAAGLRLHYRRPVYQGAQPAGRLRKPVFGLFYNFGNGRLFFFHRQSADHGYHFNQ